jgi:ADP-ribose pyrophosphatase YjhB (NUDIX family)
MGQVLREGEWEYGPAETPTTFHVRLELTTRMPPVEQIATAHCLAFDGDAIVLARHVDREWTIPGGHLEPGETVEEGMRREALEEAGAVVGVPSLFAVERLERRAGPVVSERYTNPSFQVFFVARLVSLIEPTALDECTESRRFPPEEARAAPGWVQEHGEFYEAALAWARGPDFARDCGECGFAYHEADAPNAAVAIRDGVATFAEVLRTIGDDAAHRRPAADVWSVVEYGCHLRDVLLVQRDRVLQARFAPEGVPPEPPAMLRDERVDAEGYADSAPGDVARQLTDAAALFANVLDRLSPDHWNKTIVYRFPYAWERSLRWVAVHTVHEVQHHLHDVRR